MKLDTRPRNGDEQEVPRAIDQYLKTAVFHSYSPAKEVESGQSSDAEENIYSKIQANIIVWLLAVSFNPFLQPKS